MLLTINQTHFYNADNMANHGLSRVCLHTHGCKLNQAESEELALRLAQVGYSVGDSGPADVIVLNTCTVTHVADRKARQWLRQARRQNPGSFIIATGCYAERAARDLEQLGIDLICSNRDKTQLVRFIADRFGPPEAKNNTSRHALRTRSFVKIQDGCHGPCTYCIVPKVRANVYSKPPNQVMADIHHRIALGYKEVVLTGTEVGSYRYHTDDLTTLVRRILDETPLERLRLSSLQPEHITSGMLELWKDPRLARHFHIALQSGCAETLKAMRRNYNPDNYRKKLDLIRERVPDVAITTDLIIGFPGESNRDFNDSYRFVEECGFSAVHVFPFSPRPGTVAASMPNQVSDRDKRERTLMALGLARTLAARFRRSAIGSVQDILWETEISTGSGIYSGFTSNYLRVFTRSPKPITNRILPARLTSCDRNGLWAELV